MKKYLALLALLPLAVFAASSPNDTGTPVTGSPALSAYSFSGTVGSSTQLGRIFRDGIPSACPSKVYPGIFNATTTYNYSAHTLYNNGPTACVTVSFDPSAGANPCGTNAHANAYLDSYNPANQAANFLGDVGSSVTQPFSFTVPGGSRVIIVVSNTSAQANCTYAFSSAQLDAEVAAPIVVPTLDGKWLLASIFLLGGLALSIRRYKR